VKILVTGAASGIGKSTAEELLSRDHEIIAVDRDSEGLEKLPGEISKHCLDIYNEEKVKEVVDNEDFEVLINCAGYYELGAIEDMSSEMVEKHFRSNVFGTLNMIRYAAPQLRERGGRIINISSMAGRVSPPFFGIYSATKSSIEAFSDSLRRELSEFDVDVVVVEPGPVDTGFNRRAREELGKYLPDSVYSERYEEALNSEGMNGVEAEKAAGKIVKAVETENPKNRYTVTKVAFLAPKIKCIGPEKLWDKFIGRFSY